MRKAAAVVLVAMIFGCGSGDTFSVSDTQAVLGTLSEALSTASPDQTATPNQTANVTLNVACPTAGTANITGQVTATCPTQTTCTYVASMNATFSGCEANGVAIDGALAVSFNGSSTNFTESMNGSLHASRGGQSVGTCAIDVAIAATQTSFSVSGSACGQDVSQSQ
jgi:hypothetical protein